MFTIIQNYIYSEERLKKILPAPPALLKPEDMKKVLYKEVIDELYVDMIEYFDYLISQELIKPGKVKEL